MKGIYLLIIELEDSLKKRVGARGDIKFQAGRYIYLGSGQNGVEKRVERHMRESRKKRKHWHIDYLLEDSEVKDVMIYREGKKEECITASVLKEKFDNVKGFGCSDCGCSSHLFYSKKEVPRLIESIRRFKGEEDKRLIDL